MCRVGSVHTVQAARRGTMTSRECLQSACRMLTLRAKSPPSLYVTLLMLNVLFAMTSALSPAQIGYPESLRIFSRQNPHVRLKRAHSQPSIVVLEAQPSSGSEQISCNTTFQPDDINIKEKELQPVDYNMRCQPQHLLVNSNYSLVGLRLQFRIRDISVATIEGASEFNSSLVYDENAQISLTAVPSVLADGNFTVRGRSFGRTDIELTITPLYDGGDIASDPEIITHNLVVVKSNSVINTVYLVILGLMIVMYNFGFGCKIEWARILDIVKKPVAPAIGFCCQFIIMAPLSFGVAKLLGLSDEAGLGLLAIGAAPGGGGSNVFSYLLNGDLELSITMSFISTVASLGMTPLWIWGLGRFFMGDNPKIKIPVTSVFSSLAVVTIPVIIGLLVRRWKPRAAEKIAWCLKPFTGVIGVVFLSMGIYVYFGALMRVTWDILVACIVVPVCGYAVGAAAGKIFRQTRPRWITISLETGFQNLALSLMIIGTSLEQPESDLAGVVPICYTFLSASIPTIIFIVKFFYRIHKGDKPWKKTESQDISPLHKPSEHDSPEREHDLPLDSSGVTCTVSSVLDSYHLTPGTDVKPAMVEQNGNTYLSNGGCNAERPGEQQTVVSITPANGHVTVEKL